MADPVHVEGLREFRRDLKRLQPEAAKELRADIKVAAARVAAAVARPGLRSPLARRAAFVPLAADRPSGDPASAEPDAGPIAPPHPVAPATMLGDAERAKRPPRGEAGQGRARLGGAVQGEATHMQGQGADDEHGKRQRHGKNQNQ